MQNKQINKQSNEDLLKGILENDLAILNKIYQDSLPEVIKYVRKNSGTLEDAKDVFQEGIIVIFNKVKTNSLKLTVSFHVFLFMVCKRIWLKKIKKSYKKEVTLEDEMVFSIEDNYEENLLQSKKWHLFNRKFQELAEECRKVLKMLFNGKSGKEIAEAMGYTEEYAKRKKYKCKVGLTNMIKNDIEYKNLTL